MVFNTGGRYNPSHRQLDSNERHQCALCPILSHDGLDRQRDDRLGGWDGNTPAFNTGGRYNFSTGSWTPTSTINAPEGRIWHTAVFTGNEMIVWGGQGGQDFGLLNTGGRYNPGTDSWTATNMTGVPEERAQLASVWTGSDMIVWGGRGNTAPASGGGRYDPGSDSWTATSMTNAPAGRRYPTGVWSGSEMIIWGGQAFGVSQDTGGRYCAQSGSPITLEARVRRQGGNRVVLLTWSPADGGSVNVLRNSVVIQTTDDDGTTKDRLGTQTGTFIYQVCETDSGDCSNEVAVRVRGNDD